MLPDSGLAGPLLEDGSTQGGPRWLKGTLKASLALAALAAVGGGGFAAGRLSAAGSAPGQEGPLGPEDSDDIESLLEGAGHWTPAQPAPWAACPFETRIELHMPYMDFEEEIYVHSDERHGLQRLAYYSGADTFLINTSGCSYELVPVAERESCLVTGDKGDVERIVPDLELFKSHGTHRRVTLVDDAGRESVGYEFVLNVSVLKSLDDSHFVYQETLNDHGADFDGVYRFFVNATAGGTPLNLTFFGHNTFFVESHFDEYRIVYKNFYARPGGIDVYEFMPPQGMYCQPFANPIGPFMRGPLMHGISLAMPGLRGGSARTSMLRSMWGHFDKRCGEDCGKRKHLALQRIQWLQASNRRGGNYKLGVNHLLDWTDLERRGLLGRRPVRLDAADDESVITCNTWSADMAEGLVRPMPAHLDWRDVPGVVGPPRDQGNCGSCWAFGAIGMLEGQVGKMFGKEVRLSEQHLMDCSWSFGNLACDGGNDASALSWALQRNGGQVATEDSYGSFLSENGFCHFDISKGLRGLRGVPVLPPNSQTYIDAGVEMRSCWQLDGALAGEKAAIDNLNAALVTVGPMSVSIQASLEDFYYYASGIYDNPECSTWDSDHVVLAVGYGTSAGGQEYWLLRNSWSSHWGEGGFMRIAKQGNVCGVATIPTFALLSPHGTALLSRHGRHRRAE